jgi:hypothetical protein
MRTDAKKLGVAGALCALLLCGGQALAAQDSPYRHGINITRLFDAPPRAGATSFAPWTAEVSPLELKRLREAGFDFIRLPVDPAFFLDADEAGAAQGLNQLFDFLRAAAADGFAVLVDLHPRPGAKVWSPRGILDSLDGPDFTRYTQFAATLAARLAADRNGRLALELMNEPQSPCAQTNGTDWTVFQARLLGRVRVSAPSLPLVVTGGCFSSIDGLAHLDVRNDPNLYVMIHYYEPFQFTHQGAPWSPYSRYVAGLRYPVRGEDRASAEDASRTYVSRANLGNTSPDTAAAQSENQLNAYFSHPLDSDAISRRFDLAAAWADVAGLPHSHIIVGEFGVMNEGGGLGTAPADRAARALWLHDVASVAAAHGFGWAVWGYHGAFGIVSNDASRTLDRDVIAALFQR